MVMCVGTFLPFRISYWLNGHSFIERELLRDNVRFRKDDNAFLAAADPEALQAAADRMSAGIIRKRLDYWTLLAGPKFSKKDREAINLRQPLDAGARVTETGPQSRADVQRIVGDDPLGIGSLPG
jgi:hypothetical protein